MFISIDYSHLAAFKHNVCIIIKIYNLLKETSPHRHPKTTKCQQYIFSLIPWEIVVHVYSSGSLEASQLSCLHLSSLLVSNHLRGNKDSFPLKSSELKCLDSCAGTNLRAFTHDINSLNMLTGLWIKHTHWIYLVKSDSFFSSTKMWPFLPGMYLVEGNQDDFILNFSHFSAFCLTSRDQLALNHRFVSIVLTRISPRFRDVGFSWCALSM